MKKEMETFKIVNWSEVARIAFQRKLEDLKFLQDFTADSEITLEDAERIGKEISHNQASRQINSLPNREIRERDRFFGILGENSDEWDEIEKKIYDGR